ncbi:GNAT family N-acetyltransferase [Kribbella lupini]|uniref:N-acetyltransferase domain-containing protein n=1 Tax=Kribbella lupini TaxID=291602 RepID=A0ABN2AD62_9ACTN
MDMVARAEAVEANLMLAVPQAGQRVLERMGLAVRRIGGGIALSASKDPSGFWSKAQGFGFSEPLTGDVLAEVIDFYRSEGTPSANFHLLDRVLPADWPELAAKYELTPGSTLVKLQRDDRPVAPAPTTLRVGPISADDWTAWAAVQIEAFEFADGDGRMAEMLASIGRIKNVTAYGAWDGDLLVATGALYVDGDAAELVSGATRPEYRGRGAQSALVARRTQDALAAGCRWVFSETGKPGPGERNPSLDNLQRAGFAVIYDRPIWSWKA